MINNLSLPTPIGVLKLNGKQTVLIFIAGALFGAYMLYTVQTKYNVFVPKNK